MLLRKKDEEASWYVMYAYKKEVYARDALKREHIHCFLPMRYELKEQCGRKTRILTPAISNLIFVYATRTVLTEFKSRHPYLKYATRKKGTRRELLIVPPKQMEEFILIAEKYEEDLTYYKPDEINLGKGTRVRVHGGIFDGIEGTLLKLKGKRNKRIVVEIPGVVAISAAYIQPEFIEIIK